MVEKEEEKKKGVGVGKVEKRKEDNLPRGAECLIRGCFRDLRRSGLGGGFWSGKDVGCLRGRGCDLPSVYCTLIDCYLYLRTYATCSHTLTEISKDQNKKNRAVAGARCKRVGE